MVKCRADGGDAEDIEQVGEFISNEHSSFAPLTVQRFRFERCFGPKFVDICGLNSKDFKKCHESTYIAIYSSVSDDLSSFFYPMLNNNLSSK